jgi:hypothetical protein
MSANYLNERLMPRYFAPQQTTFRLSPGDGLRTLPPSPIWY